MGFFSDLDDSSSLDQPTKQKGFFSDIPQDKNFGKHGKIVGGKVGGAIEGISNNPAQFFKEIPTALLQSVDMFAHPGSLPIPMAGRFDDVGEQVRPSEQYAEWVREGLSPEEQENAQDIADIQSLFLPIKGPKVKGFPHIPSPAQSSKVIEKLPSGLSKPAILEGGKLSKLATANAHIQKQAITNLEKESQKLLRESIHKNVPFAKSIEEGKDFSSHFNKEFKNLRASMDAANPEINIIPFNKFLSDTRKEYGSLASPSKNKKMILSDIKKFRENPTDSGKELLKTYRDNSEKIGEILETPLLGKKKRYLDFLLESNRKIKESFAKTLPEDSKWMHHFLKTNQEFSQHAAAKEVLSKFDDILGERVSSLSLRKLANEPAKQKMLRFKLGDDGANEIIGLAKDLERASLSIKKMPKSTLKKFGGAEWLMTLLPGGKSILAGKKGIDASREIYGRLLMKPKKSKVFRQALNALEKGNEKEWNLLIPQLHRLLDEDANESQEISQEEQAL